MKIDRERAQKAFADYAAQYNDADAKVKLKIDHTYRVAALCARIANAHGAKLEITSTEHVGTTVTIAVPEVLPSERGADNGTQS